MNIDPGPDSRGAVVSLRHVLATLAYRAGKALRDAPEGFAEFRLAPASRTPLQIVAHLADLMEWSARCVEGPGRWQAGGATDWAGTTGRFYAALAALDAALAARETAGEGPAFDPAVLFQGPIADALTHVGQLAMLRGAAGAGLRPESFVKAEIRVGRVGIDQAEPGRAFDGDASAPATD